ncbi:P-loop containing nucleoside triphosphate hydrolase protein [Aspergillus japonicus CBS 114.51]|uniref:Midasin n=1 Tax=Aspergillus japonicus CBS 114.51 TaxID=1448312 RepID=A0A8T8WU95_ASPJA|nr:P-loop containing nucleoside triphosphate hydrolase protein [Aspergillus japonicus CBS 114.51]RAH79405.1 P-loop containing nucleoside triphosphate hydrolase protein [Aspergillus japonicus CBS 114.51]
MDARPAYEGTLDESRLFAKLPNEIAELIHTASGTQYLNALAVGALRPGCTEGFFCLYEPIFVDLAARWLLSDSQLDQIDILSAFSRVLPFAPNLRPFASQYAIARAGPLSALAACDELTLSQINDATIRSLLLAIFRLLSYDPEVFSKAVSPSQLQSLFQHRDRSVRYLSIRCFALYMRAADAALEELIKTHFADDIVEGEWEGTTIDYRCLGLWEERRWTTLEKQVQLARSNRSTPDALPQIEKLREYFTSRTAEICGVLVPRQTNASSQPSSIVKTPTAVGNLRKIATALISARPMLLVGLPNSGKTTLINDVAATMGQAETMVTLHLNEQTDAKSLLGMYSTSPATGSFAWQPGVLTKAAREGRWILIEDLDRAPSEVIGLILPIIERGELTIASRKERIKCAEGFKIIATMKSSYNIAGEEIAPSTNILGSRLWQRVQIDSLAIDEIREVITQKYPLLESRVATIMDVYQRLCASFHGSLAIKSSQGRTPGLRDLIKLCSRMHRRLQRLGAKTGYEATPEGAEDEIFLDVVDVFLKYIPEKTLADSLSLVVAEALQISPQRARFCMHERTPTYSDQGNSLTLGRETCRKIKVPAGSLTKAAASSSRFASTRAALGLMEQVAASVQMAEPVLLVGETGIGKTTVIQQLATLMRQKLTVVNLSQQSESTDLLGGFKPVNIRTMAVPMHDEFVSLFELTFSAKKNQKFLHSVAKSVTAGNWARLVHLWHEAVRLADGVFKSDQGSQGAEEQPAKKRKLDSPKYQLLRQRWDRFAAQLNDFESQVSQGDAKFAFAFVQGKIVRALRNGEWVLLDEVNLASPDTLENIASLLHHGSEGSPSVLLSEAGDVERVFGHPDFRIFGAMNPATDAGKKDLPPGLRSRFTEFYVQSPDSDLDDLLSLIQKYLGDLALTDARAVPDLGQLYMEAKRLNTENKLTDGAGQRPHFSIRTLVRALVYVADHAHIYGLRRAIYEGFSMSFLTVLSQESERLLAPLLEKHIFSNVKNSRALLGQTPKPPNDGNDYVQFKHYWMRRGHLKPEEQPHYIITPFIEKNLKNLVRASSTRRFPVLLQGPTSAGKTSMIEFLAKVSGNQFVRINNHEHTDLQEYLGTYVSSDDGTLRYQEGVLVEALRNGYWIVLDELNLAPSDVLEALNRLLDDNRELFIPETQEVNPAGLYGGRKVLSRAFRNRFLELHFDDIPESELEYILKERSQIAPSFCTRIVSANRLFEQKNSFATLRDLFRWALRRADDREQLAINGFMLLAERVRNPQERAAVKSVIEEVMRVRIDEDVIYGASEMDKRAPNLAQLAPGIVWTKAMRRLFVLVSTALENNEPILLLCQAVAEICRKQLYIINAHVNLETGDLIGAQRPLHSDLRTMFSRDEQSVAEQLQELDPELRLRVEKNLARLNALFEWSDGSLITAMKTGQFFLLDEISLADDSVLERLNSGPIDSMVVAHEGFQFLSTMNPGGDYGKRELSAALRNHEDILPILRMKLQLESEHVPKAMLQFAKWFKTTFQNSTTSSLSIRDLLGWVEFVNRCQSSDPMFAVVQGAAMVFVDTLGANPAAILATALNDLEGNRRLCLDKLQELFDSIIDTDGTSLRVGPFILPINEQGRPDPEFIMDAPTTIGNSPILLEGSPGVGKTTLVTALAKALGKPLTRINLSEQTDLTDLFGSDVPVEGGDVGQFAWRDAPFLQAMQRGDWVLLDEMNLASQSMVHPDFVLFAAQNPHHQGGGRKGLPASFVNRFTVVRICAKLFPGSPATQTDNLVEFISLLNKAIQERRLGALGGPWEVNLRDIQRWLQLADRGNLQVPARFRSEEDRSVVSRLFGQVFGDSLTAPKSYYHNLTPGYMQVGLGFMRRDSVLQQTSDPQMQILPRDLSVLESLMLCVEQSWPSILVGSSGCGKTTLIRKLAALNGASLVELALSADTDTMDLREVSSLLLEISQYLQRQIISAYATRDTADLSSIPLQLYESLQSPDVSLDGVVASLVKLYESFRQPLLQEYANRAQRLSGISEKTDKMKVGFEWTEGVLTQAVQNGQWVVLDNANLCNPSVLDRLNSLTEPNGTLILNEQRTEDGNARIIKPHPNFRLFLTMDPRHGELSRAMRNRCVEISFLPQEDLSFAISTVPAYTCQSSLYRLRSLWNLNVTTALEGDESVSLLHEACLDHLSIADLSYLQRVQGLLPFYSSVKRYLSVIHDNSSCRPFECIKQDFAVGFASVATQGVYQPLHPLVNEPLASIMHQSVPLGWLMVLAQLQESKLGLQGLRQGLLRANESGKHLKPSQMTSLERSLASGRIPSLMKDATQPAVYDFIQSLDQTVFQVSEVIPALRAMVNFCSDIYNLTTATEVDQGEFQIYLQLGRELSASLLDGWDPLKPLALAFSQALDRFHENWALTTGLSMQRLWESWRPATSATQDQLKALLELENIALEFTQVATKTHLDLSQLSQVRKSLIAAQEAILSSGQEGYPIQDLRQTVVDLAACVPDADALQKPYFSTEFEVLCQYHDLSSLRNGQTVEDQVVQSILPLLAGRPAKPLDASSLKTQIPVILNRLSLYAGSEPSSAFGAAVSGTLSLSLLERLAYVGTTSLGQMNALEMEKKTLSKALTLTSGELAINQVTFLRQAMARLTTELVILHKDFFEPQSLEQIVSFLQGVESQGSHRGFSLPSLNLASNLPDNHFFKSFAQSHLPRLLSSLMTEQMDSTGAGIVQLAVILLQLFVPDKPFDPSGKAISSFEGELRNLGSAPPPSSFSSLRMLSRRLTMNYRSYDDITTLIVRFLQLLDLGLFLSSSRSRQETTPFLGGLESHFESSLNTDLWFHELSALRFHALWKGSWEDAEEVDENELHEEEKVSSPEVLSAYVKQSSLLLGSLRRTKKLVDLTLSTKARFAQIHKSWPDHAVLADFKHTEPVAKFLTKVEKLHGLVYEWQLITGTIIGWRRLELTTWAKLLDLEDDKCLKDVSSWWFITYEALVRAPIQIVESEVTATLEQFFRSTTNFQSLLLLYVEDLPSLSQLTQFEPPALEKNIKEQIQLASWKDTNIVALRESSRRSHVKLFKLPAQPILEQDMPEDNQDTAAPQRMVLPSFVFPEALAIPPRFKNPDNTASSMMQVFVKYTPKTLTEENKDDVQHLKMGVKRNVNTILATVPAFEAGIADDLSNVEISRSSGSVEHLLHLVANLWTADPLSIFKAHSIAWLAPIIGLAITVVGVHAKFSGLNSTGITLSHLPELPEGMASRVHKTTERPDLSFVLGQIIPWSKEYDSSLIAAADKILVSIQKLNEAPSQITAPGALLLRMADISTSLDLPFAIALTATLLPILNKFAHICRDVVDRYLTVHKETCFCSPSEPSTEESKSGQLESGTGLGEADDEDLTELAQEDKQKTDEEIENSEDARKEGDDEDDNESGSDEEDDIDEEKMWDGEHDDQQKETETQEGKGAAENDEQTAAPDQQPGQEAEKGENKEEGEEAPDEEEEALDLPEEMQLDGDEKEEQQMEGDGEQEIDQTEEAGPDDELGDADEAEEAEEEEKQEDDFLAQRDENEAAGEEVAPSEAVNGSSGNAQQESGSTDPSDEKEQKTGAAQEGDENQRHKDEGGANDSNPEDPQLQAFKKLGDVLEQWHRRQKEIMDASKQEDEEAETRLPEDTDMADADFEHLADQDDVADTQALGQANEEQAKALDQNKGVESDVKPDEDNELLPDITDDNIQDLPENRLEDEMQLDQGGAPAESQTAGAFIPGNLQSQERADAAAGQEAADEELDEVDAHLAAIHLSSTLPPLTPRDEAQRLWSYYESATTDLSLSLTEQLRLILAPTLATKLRGDFRTGKRLNIKRIIPYIASQYKRDKIWMRRSIPSKRNYQIMLAVDDSKSMLESGSGQLAFETLALVAKSLSMLEAGDLCVLGFGSEDHVRVAHEFGKPFSSEAGTQVFQHFSYQQTGTNVRKLIADSIALFREARWKQSPGGGNADLWQLELIISDGICEDHETISRLVRQAQEERIMIVFIIVDAVKGSSILDLTQASFEPDLESGSGEMKLKMKRYLEGFPFPYYLVVRDVRELPAVLATALKQWFAEVVDVSS